ncbi:MAG: hypothetical protein ACPLX7_10425 [Candidatus Kapaibacteriota bacterium]
MVDVFGQIVDRITENLLGVQVLLNEESVQIEDVEAAIYPMITRRETNLMPTAGVGERYMVQMYIYAKNEMKWYGVTQRLIEAMNGFVPEYGFTEMIFESMDYFGYSRTYKAFYGVVKFSFRNYRGNI